MKCKFEYVMEDVTTTQKAKITKDGDVKVTGDPEVYDIDGDTYVWCTTCQVRITSGLKHGGKKLAEDWQAI